MGKQEHISILLGSQSRAVISVVVVRDIQYSTINVYFFVCKIKYMYMYYFLLLH
jgi:hypothetical protein